jgi:hypothetical protein
MAYKPTQQPTGRLNKTVTTKRPSNSSTGSSVDDKNPTRFNPPAKPKKKPSKILGQDLRKTRKMNPSAKQTMRRPGLVTSKATGG